MGRRRRHAQRAIPATAIVGDLLEPEDVIFAGCGHGGSAPEIELPIVVIIPFMNRGCAPFREKHLHVVISQLLKQHVWVILSVQGECDIESKGRLIVIPYNTDTDNFHKSTLINRGIAYALKRFKEWSWLWQCDADLLFPVASVLETINSLTEYCNVAAPWRLWARLTQGQSSVVSDFPQEPRIFEQVSPRRLNQGVGAGGVLIRRTILEEGFRWDENYVNWGWEDADVVVRAAAWNTDCSNVSKGTSDAVHLWHENDRVVCEDNGRIFFKGAIPRPSHAGVLLEAKTKFLVVGMGRSGGNLLGRALALHPDIHCDNSEPFIHHVDGDIIAATSQSIRNWALLGPMNSHKPVVGMRVQYNITSPLFKFSLPDFILWAHSQDFKIIHLVREDAVEVSLSHCLARHTGNWINHRYPDEEFSVDVEEFFSLYDSVREAHALWGPKLDNLGALRINYADLCNDWDVTMGKAFDFLEVQGTIVEQPIQKQTKRPHTEYISNWDQISEMLSLRK